MKTNTTTFALAALAAALFASSSALADDSGWLVIDNHHGSLTYLRRPTTEAQKQTTVGFYGHNNGIGQKNQAINHTETQPVQRNVGLREISTAHGTVNYFAPVE